MATLFNRLPIVIRNISDNNFFGRSAKKHVTLDFTLSLLYILIFIDKLHLFTYYGLLYFQSYYRFLSFVFLQKKGLLMAQFILETDNPSGQTGQEF